MSTALLLLATIPTAPPEISVPPGFAITMVADNPLAPDVYSMTIDDAGRVLVAGRGYVRVLVDDNGDGVADRAIDLVDGLKDGPMGLLAEGDSLYVVCDGGLQRYRGYNGKDKVKQPPETLVKLKTSGEHDAHAVRRGPDGWLYLLCGNSTGVKKETITSHRSPVNEPIAGTLLRISPDGKEVEVVADGFRNAYSFDFNLDGEPFTCDSDNERCVGLPWYEPCRFYHVVPGGNYGWRSPQLGQFWRKPPYFIDCVPPVCYLGRGSPTGVACYRHVHFPALYRGGFFLADWTFGRIHFVPLTAKDSTYTGKPEVFAEALGTSGFAITGLAVHPISGELFVSIGGRGTRGGVYRITHQNSPPGKPLPIAKRSLDWSAEAGKQWLADCSSTDPRAQRTALDQILRWRGKIPLGPKLTEAVKPNLSHPDPLVRIAAGRTVARLPVRLDEVNDTQARLTLALVEAATEPDESLKTALGVIETKTASAYLKLQAIRIVQLALGDLTARDAVGTVWEGYTFREKVDEETVASLEATWSWLPRSDDPDLARELTRTLAAVGGQDRSSIWERKEFFRLARTVPDQLHYLACLARLKPTQRTTKFANHELLPTLLNLDREVARQKVPQDTFWPLRLEEIATQLNEQYADLRFWEYLVVEPEFGRPAHLLFVKPFEVGPREAARKFLEVAQKQKDYAWSPGQVALFGSLPRFEARPILLDLWEKPGLSDAILRVLPPQPGDQPKFVIGLQSFDPEVIRLSAVALAKLSPPEGPTELVAAIKALRRLAPEDKAAREAVGTLLQKRTGEKLAADPKAWTEWTSKNYPKAVKLLAANDGFDPIGWKKREAGIDWDKGDATRGRITFAKATCAACHDGGRAMGPSLLGVAKRFSRDDLLTAVLQPSKDVSPRYRPTRMTTTDDKVFVGMIVYEATDGVLLQTNADTVIRIAGESIASKRPVEVSMMPAGLLDKLTDVEIADLFAYLKSLDEPKPK